MIQVADVFATLFPGTGLRNSQWYERKRQEGIDAVFPWIKSWYVNVPKSVADFIRVDKLVSYMEAVSMMGQCK